MYVCVKYVYLRADFGHTHRSPSSRNVWKCQVTHNISKYVELLYSVSRMDLTGCWGGKPTEDCRGIIVRKDKTAGEFVRKDKTAGEFVRTDKTAGEFVRKDKIAGGFVRSDKTAAEFVKKMNWALPNIGDDYVRVIKDTQLTKAERISRRLKRQNLRNLRVQVNHSLAGREQLKRTYDFFIGFFGRGMGGGGEGLLFYFLAQSTMGGGTQLERVRWICSRVYSVRQHVTDRASLELALFCHSRFIVSATLGVKQRRFLWLSKVLSAVLLVSKWAIF